MKIEPFHVEEWMNAYETGATYNIAETCVDSISLNQLFELTGQDKQTFLDEFCRRRLTYGDIEGAPQFRQGVCRLYRNLEPAHIIPVHGASGANHHVFYSLIQPDAHLPAALFHPRLLWGGSPSAAAAGGAGVLARSNPAPGFDGGRRQDDLFKQPQ